MLRVPRAELAPCVDAQVLSSLPGAWSDAFVFLGGRGTGRPDGPAPALRWTTGVSEPRDRRPEAPEAPDVTQKV